MQRIQDGWSVYKKDKLMYELRKRVQSLKKKAYMFSIQEKAGTFAYKAVEFGLSIARNKTDHPQVGEACAITINRPTVPGHSFMIQSAFHNKYHLS
jgi:hypothetical protein